MSFELSVPGTSLTLDTGTPTSTDLVKKGTPASMTLLFGSIVIFSSLFAAFLLLCFFWQYRRARRRRIELEYDEAIDTYRGVPELWEVWTQGEEPNGGKRGWESVRPLSIDVERAPRVNREPTTTSPTSHLRRSLRNAFRRPATPPSEAPSPADGLEDAAASAVPMSSLRITFIIAMPCAEPPNPRHSMISQGPSVNGDLGHREYALGIYHAPFREGSIHESIATPVAVFYQMFILITPQQSP